MEWVETVGASIDEATEKALDLLGVPGEEADVVVVSDARMGLFGKVREPARVRARVRPMAARTKEDRRDRRRRGANRSRRAPETPAPAVVTEGEDSEESPDLPAKAEQGGAMSAAREDVPVEVQADVAERFLRGIVERLDLGQVEISRRPADEMVEVSVDGAGVGILVGSRGTTLSALQEITRTVVLRETGVSRAMIVVDVGGYRMRRRAALEDFTRRIAAEVIETGAERVLEPMNPPDRKVVHDTVNTVAGVLSRSEGEEPSRYVVIYPDPS